MNRCNGRRLPRLAGDGGVAVALLNVDRPRVALR